MLFEVGRLRQRQKNMCQVGISNAPSMSMLKKGYSTDNAVVKEGRKDTLEMIPE